MNRRIAFRVLVAALTTVIAAAAAEGMFRWYVRRSYGADFPPWTAHLVPLPAPQVFTFKPHVSGIFTGSVDESRTFPYRTNAQGLRDRDRPGRPPGGKRVLVIGDSYTWGYAVAEEDAFPQTAERLLKELGHPDIDVINGGIPDYNSRQERQLLEQLLPIYQPDAVFLAYVVNDAEPSTAMPVPPEEAYRHAGSWFLAALQETLNHRVFGTRVLRSRKDTFVENYLEGFSDGAMKWRDSREAIREMRDLCAARGVPFTILMLPDFTQPLDDRYGWRPIHEAVLGWGRELSVPAYDLLIPFRGEDHTALWVPWDGHPNAAAHRRIAEFLIARIREDARLVVD